MTLTPIKLQGPQQPQDEEIIERLVTKHRRIQEDEHASYIEKFYTDNKKTHVS